MRGKRSCGDTTALYLRIQCEWLSSTASTVAWTHSSRVSARKELFLENLPGNVKRSADIKALGKKRALERRHYLA